MRRPRPESYRRSARAGRAALAVLLALATLRCDATSLLSSPARPLDLGGGAAEDDDPALIRGMDGAYYLAFLSTRSGDKRIWLTRSTDAAAWEPPVLVSQIENVDAEDAYPSLVEASPGTFLISYTRRFREAPFPSQVMSRVLDRARDGERWTAMSAEAAATPAGSDGRHGRLVRTNGVVRLFFTSADLSRTAWRDKGAYNHDVYMAEWDGRRAWGAPRLLRAASSATDADHFPDVAETAPGELTLVMQRQSTDNDGLGADATTDIWYTTSADDGATWTEPLRITDNVVGGTAAKGHVHAVPRLVLSTQVPTWFVVWTSTAFAPEGGFTVLARGREREYPDRALNASSAANPGLRGWAMNGAPVTDDSTWLVWAADTPVDGERRVRLWTAVTPH